GIRDYKVTGVQTCALPIFFISAFGSLRGEIYFFLLYFISIFASVIPSYEKHKNDYHYNAVGASGAVSAVVFSAIIVNPWMSLSRSEERRVGKSVDFVGGGV